MMPPPQGMMPGMGGGNMRPVGGFMDGSGPVGMQGNPGMGGGGPQMPPMMMNS